MSKVRILKAAGEGPLVTIFWLALCELVDNIRETSTTSSPGNTTDVEFLEPPPYVCSQRGFQTNYD